MEVFFFFFSVYQIVHYTAGQSKAKGQPFLRITTDTRTLIFEFQNEKIRDNVWDIIQSLIPSGQGKQGLNHSADLSKSKALQKIEAAKKRLLNSDKYEGLNCQNVRHE